jgi:hypothetical protein
LSSHRCVCVVVYSSRGEVSGVEWS